MKKTKILIAALLAFSMLSLASCSIMDLSSMVSSDGSNTANNNKNEDYLTRDEVEAIISGIQENVTVNGGDVYNTTLMQNIREMIELNIAGMASAMALLLGLIISIFSAIQFKMMKSKD